MGSTYGCRIFRPTMAPPGYNPPSYAHNNIPTRYMHKDPPPPGTDTNGRAYFIFFSYLGLCFSLSVFIIYRLVQNYNLLSKSTQARLPEKRYVRTFAILAALSLFTTWYHMFNYFRVSYQAWAMWRSRFDISQDHMHWGLWLKETSLFREAWETVIVGNARYWWSHQIFFFASGLGLSLEERGTALQSDDGATVNSKQEYVAVSSTLGPLCYSARLLRSASQLTCTSSPCYLPLHRLRRPPPPAYTEEDGSGRGS